MPVYTRANLTDNLWKVGEIWIPNKETKKDDGMISVSGFGVNVYDVQVIEDKEKNSYQVIFCTLGKYKALMGQCTYQDAHNQNLKAEQVPFWFGIYDNKHKLDQSKSKEIYNMLPEELKLLNNKFTNDYINGQFEKTKTR